jgi:signal transduction histidine kinase
MSLKTTLYTVAFVLTLGMVITLIVFWNIYIIGDYQTIKELHQALHGNVFLPSGSRWTILVLGIVFLSVILTVLSVFFASLLRDVRFKQQQKDFVNMVTHELRLPMSSIQMFAQTLSRNDMPESDRNTFLDRILGECQRMNALVDHLLKSQAIETGRLGLDPQTLEMGTFIKDFVKKWPRALELAALDKKIFVAADPVLLELAMVNLVSNAEKYGHGIIPAITVTQEGRRLSVTVFDGGPPIPRKFIKHLFKRFYRMPIRETRRQTGVGLGLYIVRSILRLHKGQVVVTPDSLRPDSRRGNAFTLIFPSKNEALA